MARKISQKYLNGEWKPPVLSERDQRYYNDLREDLRRFRDEHALTILTPHTIGNRRFAYAQLPEKIGTIFGKSDTPYFYVWCIDAFDGAINFVGKCADEKRMFQLMRKYAKG